MAQYILRNLPDDLWLSFKTRAAREGWPLRALLLQLMHDYAVGHIRPSGIAPMPRQAPVRLQLGTPLTVGGQELRAPDRKPYMYPVLGMPPGQEARIAIIDHRWKIHREARGHSSGWVGDFNSAEEALRSLENIINQGG